jgi:glycine reductase complex component B subunit alpha and beta
MQLATFDTKSVVASASTQWRDGRLELDLNALRKMILEKYPTVESIGIDIVRPGDAVRVVNVLDAVEPVVKADDPSTTFPGALGQLTIAGRGQTNRLGGVALLSTADLKRHTASKDFPDSLVDMGGPGAVYSYWSRTTNVVLNFVCDSTVDLVEVDRSIRRATLDAAKHLASATLEAVPDNLANLSLDCPISSSLPSVCVILQVASEGPGDDTYLYGAPVEGMLPILLDPCEVLDGALISAAYDSAAVQNPTYFYQRNQLIRDLLAANANRLRFAGVVLTLAYLNSSFEKRRVAMLAAKLASQLGADGAVLTTFSSGNSHTDTMLTCQACERLGVRTTVVLAETNSGLTDHVAQADCVVSVGNDDELVDQWHPDRILGGDRLRDGRPASDPGYLLPVRAYLGATSQMGDMSIQGVAE